MTLTPAFVKWYSSVKMSGAAVRRDLIVIGASAGGVEALKRLVAQLPADLPAAVLITLHVWSEGRSILPQILSKAGLLPAEHGSDGEPLQYSRIYVAPPDFHMMVRNGHIELTHGPKENRHRPAIDPLFRSAAFHYGRRVVGVILTGTLSDGAAGLMAVKRRGGVAIVQDPGDAEYGGMPVSAIDYTPVDYILRLTEIPRKIVQLAGQVTGVAVASPFSSNNTDRQDLELAEAKMETIEDEQGRGGKPSVYSCPDCNGTLWELDEDGLLRFRCRVGHAYSAASLSMEQSERIEEALWTAFRATEEAASLHRRIAERARARGDMAMAEEHELAADHQERSAHVLRDLVLKPEPRNANLQPEASETER
jgi:two-component system chemotaxis response regulator CheB